MRTPRISSGPADIDAKALKWRCRRGMRELDVLLSDYLSHRYTVADPVEQAGFRALLECQDPEIFSYLTGRAESCDPAIQNVICILRRGSDR